MLVGHLHPHAGRRPRRTPSAAAPTCATCAARPSGRSRWPRRAPLDDARAAARRRPRPCATTPSVVVDADGGRRRRLRQGARPRPSSASTGDGPVGRARRRRRPAGRLRAAPRRHRQAGRRGRSGRRPSGRAGSLRADAGAPRRRRARRAAPTGTVVTIGAYDGVHLGHQAVIAPGAARWPPSAGLRPAVVTFDRHPASGRAARVGAAAAHRPRPEARAARRRPASTTRSSSTSTRPRSKEPAEDFVQRGAGRRASTPRPSSSARTSTSATSGGATSRCCASMGAELRLRRRSGSSWSAPTADRRRASRSSSTAIRRALAGGDVDAPPTPCSAGPTRCAASVVARRRAGPRRSASRPPTSTVPDEICLPADGIYAGWYERPDGARPPARHLPRPAPDVLRAGRRARCSRPTCSTSTATSTASRPRSASSHRLRGERALRLGRRPRRPDRAATATTPARACWPPSTPGRCRHGRPMPPSMSTRSGDPSDHVGGPTG